MGIVQYLNAVALNPQYKEALFNLASSYQVLGKMEEAKVFYERVLKLPGTKDILDDHALEQLGRIKELEKSKK